jgi:hypothetical protein
MTYLRFGIRDLLWAMALLGMGIGWWVDRRDTGERLATVEWQLDSVISLVKMFGDKVTVTDHRVDVKNNRGLGGAFRLRNDTGPVPLLGPGESVTVGQAPACHQPENPVEAIHRSN